jgi:hypothetical protein
MTNLRKQAARIAIFAALIMSGAGHGLAADPRVANPPAADPRVAEATKAAAVCSSVKPDPAEATGGGTMEPAAFKVMNTDVLCVTGNFYFNSSERIAAIPDPAAIKYLVIDSGGGIVLPAIQLAEMAERYRWLVVVSRSCYSSCANYVFLSDTDKIVLRGAFVMWHGLPYDSKTAREQFDRELAARGGKLDFGPPGTSATPDQAFKFVMANAVQSEKFFASRGISQDLANRPPEPNSTFSPAYAEQYKKARQSGKVNWTYSKRALIHKWKVRRILWMWEPADKEAATATIQKKYGWQLFFFN